jgi:hypothetical protein
LCTKRYVGAPISSAGAARILDGEHGVRRDQRATASPQSLGLIVPFAVLSWPPRVAAAEDHASRIRAAAAKRPTVVRRGWLAAAAAAVARALTQANAADANARAAKDASDGGGARLVTARAIRAATYAMAHGGAKRTLPGQVDPAAQHHPVAEGGVTDRAP